MKEWMTLIQWKLVSEGTYFTFLSLISTLSYDLTTPWLL